MRNNNCFKDCFKENLSKLFDFKKILKSLDKYYIYISKYKIIILSAIILLIILLPLYVIDWAINYINLTPFKLIFILIILYLGVILILYYIYNKNIFIITPFIILIISFIIFLYFWLYIFDLDFFITDFLNIINPYLMTFWFVIYWALIFNDKYNNISILSHMILYLILILFFYFSSLYLQSNSVRNFIQIKEVIKCNNDKNKNKENKNFLNICITNKSKRWSEISWIINYFSDEENKFFDISYFIPWNYNKLESYFICFKNIDNNYGLNSCREKIDKEFNSIYNYKSQNRILLNKINNFQKLYKLFPYEKKMFYELKNYSEEILKTNNYKKFIELKNNFKKSKFNNLKIKILYLEMNNNKSDFKTIPS